MANPRVSRHLEEFVRLKCAPDLLACGGLFPNVKEITESMGVFDGVRRHLWSRGFDPADPSVVVVCPGDGRRPRLGAMFAYRTSWTVLSVDPRTKWAGRCHIARLTCLQAPFEQLGLTVPVGAWNKVVVAAQHSHAPLNEGCYRIWRENPTMQMGIVSMPCCVEDDLPNDMHLTTYVDKDVLSDANVVNVFGTWGMNVETWEDGRVLP